MKEASSKGVKFVELEYVDLSGTLRSEILSLETFESKKGGSFDASSVGLSVIEWSDAVLIPDPQTAVIKD
ncbi:MAG: glutamine synthetase beta-grasp domain-containing protein, partial [Candidatus Korarchaeota archaeon]|nr:glutamine synthetase beta-grasp domain-containing protein [Candidatus Korarchaeota archaeon]